MQAGAALHFGHSVVLMDKWDPEEMLRLIETYRVTESHMVPTQFHRLLQEAQAFGPVGFDATTLEIGLCNHHHRFRHLRSFSGFSMARRSGRIL